MHQALVLVGLLLISSCYVESGQLPSGKKCDFSIFKRAKCGDQGITETECVAKGCCFSSRQLPRIPQCYTFKGSCNVFPLNRKECGNSLSEIPCKAKGCCYEEGFSASGLPNCYYQQ